MKQPRSTLRKPLARPLQRAAAVGQVPQPRRGPAPSFLQLSFLILILLPGAAQGGLLQPLVMDLPRLGVEAERGQCTRLPSPQPGE